MTVRTTTGETPGCKGGPMEYAWWRDLVFGDSGGAICFGDGWGKLVVVVSRVTEVRKGDGEDMPQVGR